LTQSAWDPDLLEEVGMGGTTKSGAMRDTLKPPSDRKKELKSKNLVKWRLPT